MPDKVLGEEGKAGVRKGRDGVKGGQVEGPPAREVARPSEDEDEGPRRLDSEGQEEDLFHVLADSTQRFGREGFSQGELVSPLHPSPGEKGKEGTVRHDPYS